jgi:hypothetical protein
MTLEMNVRAGMLSILCWLCWLSAWGLSLAPGARAADYALVPSLRVEERYNDNIFFDDDAGDPQDDYITTLTPALRLRRHAERLVTELYGQGRFVFYRDEKDLNDNTGQRYGASLNHQATERFSWGASGRYTVDNQVDRDIDVSGLVFSTVERRRQDYRLFGDLWTAERTSLNLSGGYAQELFDEPEFWENWGADAGLGLSHRPRIWPNTVLQAQASYRHYRFHRDQTHYTPLGSGTQITRVEEGNVTDNAALTLGLGCDLTERLNLGLNAGARHTYRKSESEVRNRILFGQAVLEGGSSDNSSGEALWGFVGGANLAYRGERNEFTLGISHDLQPASGSGDTVQRTSLNTSWWYQMTSEWRFSTSASLYLNRSDVKDSGDRDTETVTITVAPLMRYAFSRDVYLQGQYRFTQVDDHVDNKTSRRHLAAVALFGQHDLLD